MADEPLPAGIEALWGMRDRPRRGPKPALSVEAVVRAGVEIADAEGLGPLSMSRLAERLGYTPMSLYRYVHSKDELLVLMMDAAAYDMAEPPATGGWRERLRGWSVALADLYRRHPWVLLVPIGAPPAGPGQLTALDRGLATLRETALPPEARLGVIMLLLTYVRGEVRFAIEYEQSMRAAAAADTADGRADATLSYGAVLRRLIDARRFPDLAVLVEAGVFDGADDAYRGDTGDEMGEQFAFGIERVLDGIGALIDAATAARSGT